DEARSVAEQPEPFRLDADVEARDVLQPHDRDPVVVARARKGRELRDAVLVQDAGGLLRAARLHVVDQTLAVGDEAHVEPADAPDADDRLAPALGPGLPEESAGEGARENR